MKVDPISVLMFSNATVRGGVEEHILQLLRGLDRERFRLHLACTPELARLLSSDLPADVQLFQLTLDHLSDIAGAWKLAQVCRQHRIQILHSHMFRAGLFASPIGRLSRVPVILETAHIRENWRKGWKSSFVVDRLADKCMDHVIAVSEAISRYLIEDKRLPPGKISVIRTAADLSRFRLAVPPSAELKVSAGFERDDRLVLLTGRLEPQKGHRVLLEALPQVLRQFPCVRVLFLGEGSLQRELESYVAEHGLNHAVRFLGFRPNPQDWLALAEFSVLPSFYEGLPMTVLESLAMGRTAIATAVDGTPEIVLDGKTGLLVPPGDPAALAAAMCRLLQDPELAQQMGRAGREFVVPNFGVEKLVRSTEALYLRAWENLFTTEPQKTPRELGPGSACLRFSEPATPSDAQATAHLRSQIQTPKP
jgi:glycosyltransferase involved in cell wall biosynthesis